MKIPDDITQALGQGNKHGRGWTSMALTMMAIASLGGVLWGIWAKPQADQCSLPFNDDPQNMQCPTARYSKAKKAEISPKARMPCYSCGMG